MKAIGDLRLAKDKTTATVTYDQIDLVIKIHYVGELLSLPFVGQKRTTFLEEESFSYGLADFWSDVYPDKLKSSTDNGQVEIVMAFQV